MRVLITGGTGKTGRRLAERLRAQGKDVRIATRNPSSAHDRRFDWGDRATWAPALDGVTAIYLVAPPGDASPVIDFARQANRDGGRRFVLLSASLLPAGGPGAGQVHQWLIDNAAEWAVLRPSWFMENFSEGPHRATIQSEDRIYSAAADGRVAFIGAEDIAAVARAALTAPKSINADLVLTGPAAISYDQAAAILSRATGREISHVRISAEDLAARHRDRGTPPALAAILAGMDGLIANGAEDRTTGDVEAVSGSKPVAFEAFCRENTDAWTRVSAEP
ncbi:MAG TPA: ergot alkaloid biosynthesis protein [Caulobacteraceae bacterium]